MNRNKMLNILQTLANGVNPITGEIFDEDSPYQDVLITRALFEAFIELKGKEDKNDKNSPRRKRGVTNDQEIILDTSSQRLLKTLKDWRTAVYLAIDKPAYVVMTNMVLQRIAHYKPTNNEELLAIQGIGPSKLKQYGDEILALVSTHNDKN